MIKGTCSLLTVFWFYFRLSFYRFYANFVPSPDVLHVTNSWSSQGVRCIKLELSNHFALLAYKLTRVWKRGCSLDSCSYVAKKWCHNHMQFHADINRELYSKNDLVFKQDFMSHTDYLWYDITMAYQVYFRSQLIEHTPSEVKLVKIHAYLPKIKRPLLTPRPMI